MKWRPISTMPKDGTKVLIYLYYNDGDGDPDNVGVIVGQWCEHAMGFNIQDQASASGTWHIKGAWAWMPLPPPPSFT